MAGRGWVKFYVLVEVELLVTRGDAVSIGDAAGLAGGILGIERRRRAADEPCGFAEDIRPPRRVQGSIVDVSDQRRELLCLVHGNQPRCQHGRIAHSALYVDGKSAGFLQFRGATDRQLSGGNVSSWPKAAELGIAASRQLSEVHLPSNPRSRHSSP